MEQNKQEFYWMMAKVGAIRSVLEVGSREGGALLELAPFLPYGSRICSIDIGQPHPEWHNGRDPIPGLRAAIVTLCSEGFDAEVLFADSGDQRSLAWARERSPFDLVIIDADHDRAAVKRDWEFYSGLGRTVALHDLAVNGVASVWAEIIMAGFTVEEMRADGGTGVGIVRRVM